MLTPIEPTSRRLRTLRTCALLAFVVLLAFGPLAEHTWPERLFTTTLVFLTVLVVLFATARVALAFLVATLVFGAIEIAGTLKFTYLQTPVLAPDIEFFVNRDTIGVIARYPMLLAVSVTALILIPLLPILAFAGEPPSLLRDRPRAVRGSVRVLGALAAAAMLLVSLIPSGPFMGVFNKPMWITINDRSFLTDFFTSFNDTVITRPEIPDKIDRTVSWKLDRPLQAPATKPDVVAILEESHVRSAHPQGLHAAGLQAQDVRRRQIDARARPAHGAYVRRRHLDQRVRGADRPCAHVVRRGRPLCAVQPRAARRSHAAARVPRGRLSRDRDLPDDRRFPQRAQRLRLLRLRRVLRRHRIRPRLGKPRRGPAQGLRAHLRGREARASGPAAVRVHADPAPARPAHDAARGAAGAVRPAALRRQVLAEGSRQLAEPESQQLSRTAAAVRRDDGGPREIPARRRASGRADAFRRPPALVRRRDPRDPERGAQGSRTRTRAW